MGITASLFLGLLLGGLVGYYGGWVDSVIQRVIKILRSFPELPLWMALSAVLPVRWSPILIFFGITLILAPLDWTGLASHIIASATISIPGMILGETALSFLGLGLRPPITSWRRATQRSPKYERSRALPVANPASSTGNHRHPRLQFLRRRPARRGGSL